MPSYVSISVGAADAWDVGASLAYYVLNACAASFALCAIVQLFWPLAVPKLVMTKLTDNETSLDLLAAVSRMLSLAVLNICALSFIGANYALSVQFVGANAFFYLLCTLAFPFAKNDENIGLKRAYKFPIFVTMLICCVLLTYATFTYTHRYGHFAYLQTVRHWSDESLAGQVLVGINLFFSFVGVTVMYAGEDNVGRKYFPDSFPKDKYGAAQLNLMIQHLGMISLSGSMISVTAILSADRPSFAYPEDIQRMYAVLLGVGIPLLAIYYKIWSDYYDKGERCSKYWCHFGIRKEDGEGPLAMLTWLFMTSLFSVFGLSIMIVLRMLQVTDALVQLHDIELTH